MLKISRVIGLSFVIIWTILIWSKPIGVTVEQATEAVELKQGKKLVFPITELYEKAGFGILGTGEKQLRILGTLVLVAVIGSCYKAVSTRLAKNQKWAAMMSASSLPWIYLLSANYWGEAISVAGLGIFWAMRANPLLGAAGLIIMGGSSFAGWIAATALAVGQVAIKKKSYLPVVVLLIGWAGIHSSEWKNLVKNDFTASLSPTKLGEEINAQKKAMYLSANKTEVMPAWLAKITYNKADFALKTIVQKAGSTIDPTLWTAVRPAWVITGLSKIPPKGIWDTVYYWQIPLAIIGAAVTGLSVSGIGLAGAAWLPLFMADAAKVNTFGALLIPGLIYLIARGTAELGNKNKFFGAALILFNIAAFGYFINQVFQHTSDFQDTRITSYRQIYDLYRGLAPKYKNYVITDRQGPTQTMLDFYSNGLPAEVKIEAFDWTTMVGGGDAVYIGFTREFIGSRYLEDDKLKPPGQILGQSELPDEPIHNYGRILWAVPK